MTQPQFRVQYYPKCLGIGDTSNLDIVVNYAYGAKFDACVDHVDTPVNLQRVLATVYVNSN